MRLIQKHQNGRGIVAASDNTRTNAKTQAEMAYQNRARTKLQFRKEEADKRAEEAVKEREARRRDPEYDEKKRRAEVEAQINRANNGKYRSNKKTFVGRFADNLYHNSGASYYVDRAKQLSKEGATPLEQLTNAGLGLIGTVTNSTVGGVDAIGNVVSPNSNVGSGLMELLSYTPIGAVPMFIMEAGKQLGGARGENVGEVLATVAAGRGNIGRGAGRAARNASRTAVTYPPRPVQLAPGQAWVPGIYINPVSGVPSYYRVSPNPNQASWEHVGANIWEPMTRAEIAEATQNGTLRYLYENGNVGSVWRNIAHNGGVHVQMRRGPHGGYFLPDNSKINLPDGLEVPVEQSLAREYYNGTYRYPALLNDTEIQTLAHNLGGVSAEFDGYGIRGPRYRVNYDQGRPSVVYRYPEISSILNPNRPFRGISLQEAIQGLTNPTKILEAKWNWMEQNASNPELVRSVRRALESEQNTSPVLSALSNEQIDYLVNNNMLKEPKHTRNLVAVFDEDGTARPFSVQEAEESVKKDWNNRRHGSVFDFGSTNSYSYQSHLKALLTIIKKIEDGEARLLRPGTREIHPNSIAAIKVGDVSYPGMGVGRASGAMDLSKLNRHYRFAYDKLNELGHKQYGDSWVDLVWEDITPDQIKRQYTRGEHTRTHADIRALFYKNGGKANKLYDRRFISKIKGV